MLIIKPGRPATAVRVRSVSFTGTFAANHTHLLAPRQQSSSPASVRCRSSWRSDERARYLAVFGTRLASSLHSPDCRWVREPGNPKHAPRDQDCPQCRREEQMPEELTERELRWRKSARFWREFLDREPYQAIFGPSNAMLAGANWMETAKQMRADFADRLEVHQRRHFKALSSSHDPSSISLSSDTRGPRPSSPDKAAPAQESSVGNANMGSNVHGYGSWSYKSTDGKGRVIEESSGEYIFDPITMRMIPKLSAPEKDNPSTPPVAKADTGLQTIKSATNNTIRPSKPPEESPKPIFESKTEQESLKIKEGLENSWRKERAHKDSDLSNSDKLNSARNSAPLGETSSEKQQAQSEATTESRSRERLARRNQRIVEMSHKKVERGRAAIIDLWKKRIAIRLEGNGDRAAELLGKEIAQMKLNMAALYGRKPRHEESASTTTTDGEPGRVAANSDSKETALDTAGEGDLSPSATEFANKDRWYKNKAPHARADEQSRLEDMNLVKDIRQIYEESYGRIDAAHRQGQLRASVDEQSSNTPSEAEVHKTPSAFDPDAMDTRKHGNPKETVYEDPVHAALKEYEDRPETPSYSFKPGNTRSVGSGELEHPKSASSENQVHFNTQETETSQQKLEGEPPLHSQMSLEDPKQSPATSADPTANSQALYKRSQDIKSLEEYLEKTVEAERAYYAQKDASPSENIAQAALVRDSAESALSGEKDTIESSTPSSPKLTPALERYVNQPSNMSDKEPIGEASNSDMHATPSRSQSSIGNYASPTGFYRDFEAEPSQKTSPSETMGQPLEKPASTRVRREEPVFSGSKDESSDWRGSGSRRGRRSYRGHGKHRERGLLGQMLLSATIIGGFCYAAGVTVEMMRDSHYQVSPVSPYHINRGDGSTNSSGKKDATNDALTDSEKQMVLLELQQLREALKAQVEVKQTEDRRMSEAGSAQLERDDWDRPVYINVAPVFLAGGCAWVIWKIFGGGS